MARLVSGEALWVELRKAARKSRTLAAAVAFVGRNARSVLKWPSGTRLVTALTEDRVKRGATSAKGVKQLVGDGVSVRVHPDLHAKVYVFDRVAFVGSANASESSTRLEEAAVILTKPAEVRAARAFVANLWRGASAVDQRLLSHLAKLEPKWVGVPVGGKKTRPVQQRKRRPVFLDGRTIWISAVEPIDVPSSVDRIRDAHATKLVGRDEVSNVSEVDWVTSARRAYRRIPEQDWIFYWWKPTSRSPRGRLDGPHRCLGGVDLGRRAGGHRYSIPDAPIAASSFALDANGVKLLARLTPKARTDDGSPIFAEHLHDRIGAKDVSIGEPAKIAAFSALVRRLK